MRALVCAAFIGPRQGVALEFGITGLRDRQHVRARAASARVEIARPRNRPSRTCWITPVVATKPTFLARNEIDDQLRVSAIGYVDCLKPQTRPAGENSPSRGGRYDRAHWFRAGSPARYLRLEPLVVLTHRASVKVPGVSITNVWYSSIHTVVPSRRVKT